MTKQNKRSEVILKNIKISEDLWWKLSRLKADWRLPKIADVIERVLKNGKY